MNEALRLADALERDKWHVPAVVMQAAADELRRLHQFAEDQIGRATAAEAALQMTKATHALKIAAVEAQRDALLEALRYWLPDETMIPAGHEAKWNEAVAAIAAAEGEKS